MKFAEIPNSPPRALRIFLPSLVGILLACGGKAVDEQPASPQDTATGRSFSSQPPETSSGGGGVGLEPEDDPRPPPPRIDVGACDPAELGCCYAPPEPVLCVGECSRGVDGQGCLGRGLPAARDQDELITVCCGEGENRRCQTNSCGSGWWQGR